MLVELPTYASALAGASSRLERLRDGRPGVRTAVFTSTDPARDAVRLATEQGAELLLVANAPDALLAAAPCDVALTNARDELGDGPILVPFGGARSEWPALELAAWLARAHARRLRLLGVEASAERRDASRALAAASLALQRFASVDAETALVSPGAAGVPVLLVHGGLRPGGLAPDRTMTRFSWSLSGGEEQRAEPGMAPPEPRS